MLYDVHRHTPPEAGITAIRNIDLLQLQAGVDFSQEQYVSLGLHPFFLPGEYNPALVDTIRRHLGTASNIVALGECGFDSRAAALLTVQQQYFDDIAVLAGEYHLPLFLHCVGGYHHILRATKSHNLSAPWILHGFSKGKVLAHQLVEAGLYLSFGANLIHLTHVQEALLGLPLDKILLETDEEESKAVAIQDVYNAAIRLYQDNSDIDIQQTMEQNFISLFGGASK